MTSNPADAFSIRSKTFTSVIIQLVDIEEEFPEFVVSCLSQCKPATFNQLREDFTFLTRHTYIEGDGTKLKLMHAIQSKWNKFYKRMLSIIADKLGVYPPLCKEGTMERIIENSKPDPVAFLSKSHLLLPNMKADNLLTNLDNLVEAVHVLRGKLSEKDSGINQYSLFLYSETTGGSGKGIFLKFLEHWIGSEYYKEETITDSRFVNLDFYNKGIVGIQEVPQLDKGSFGERFNNIIDGKSYGVEFKGKDIFQIKPRCFLITAGNHPIEDDNSRRYLQVDVSNEQLDRIQEVPKYYKVDDSDKNSYPILFEDYVPIVEEWIESVPERGYLYSSNFTPLVSSKSDQWYNLISKKGKRVVHWDRFRVFCDWLQRQTLIDDYTKVSPISLVNAMFDALNSKEEFHSYKPLISKDENPRNWKRSLKLSFNLMKNFITRVDGDGSSDSDLWDITFIVEHLDEFLDPRKSLSSVIPDITKNVEMEQYVVENLISQMEKKGMDISVWKEDRAWLSDKGRIKW